MYYKITAATTNEYYEKITEKSEKPQTQENGRESFIHKSCGLPATTSIYNNYSTFLDENRSRQRKFDLILYFVFCE